MKKKKIFFAFFILANVCFLVATVVVWNQLSPREQNQLFSPFVSEEKVSQLPLIKYSIPNLANYSFQADQKIKIEKIISRSEKFTAYQFSFTTMGKKMTGQLNIPVLTIPAENGLPVIVMLRGWAPAETYTTGTGTKNSSAHYANNGFITIAPDFFGYGGSDADFSDSWEGRFSKPINVIELIKTLETSPILSLSNLSEADKKTVPASLADVKIDSKKIGLWGHSNGGQIALATLEVLSQIKNETPPTTLWAPVTAPFPYSILFFTDENADEGKEARKWLAMFEENYDVFDYSLTQHLDKLFGPIQIHHGTADEAALKTWSDEFIEKVDIENKRRKTTADATDSASLQDSITSTPIEIQYFTYPGADHNLQPGWDLVVARDVAFFKKNLNIVNN